MVTLIGIGRRAKNSRPGRVLALCVLVLLWDASVFALVRSAGELAALTSATIYVCHASQEFFLAWIILHEPFLALRVRPVSSTLVPTPSAPGPYVALSTVLLPSYAFRFDVQVVSFLLGSFCLITQLYATGGNIAPPNVLLALGAAFGIAIYKARALLVL